VYNRTNRLKENKGCLQKKSISDRKMSREVLRVTTTDRRSQNRKFPSNVTTRQGLKTKPKNSGNDHARSALGEKAGT